MVHFDHGEEHIDEKMVMIQANIDDMNPEYCTFVSDLLFEHGANDVYWIPIMMKKGRPGLMLNVFVSQKLLNKMKAIIFEQTTTLGIRYWDANCHRLGRKWVSVETPWGDVRVKVGYFQGKAVQYAPEFRDCEAIAHQHNIPLKQVYDVVRERYERLKKE